MNPLSRRQLLQSAACGFGSLAFSDMATRAARAAEGVDPLAPRKPHHTPKAKRIIFLFMQGGVSHVDSWDHKPYLDKHNGKKKGFDDARTIAKTGKRGTSQRIMKSLWNFKQRGKSGL